MTLPQDVPSNPPILRSETVFEGAVWDIRREDFEYGDQVIRRDYMDHTGAVVIAALDEHDRLLLIQQYRHPIRMREWELPAGLLDIAGEDPVDAAARELAEEADLAADEWHLLSEFFPTPGGSDEAVRIYLARGLHAVPAFERTEEEADIVTEWVPLDDVIEAFLTRSITNAYVGIGAMAIRIARENGWATLGDPRTPWTRHPKFAAPAAE